MLHMLKYTVRYTYVISIRFVSLRPAFADFRPSVKRKKRRTDKANLENR